MRQITIVLLATAAIGGNAHAQPYFYVSDEITGNVLLDQVGFPATTYVSGLGNPILGLAVGPSGNLYVSDTGHNAVKIATQGSATLFASVPAPTGLAFDGLGNLYAASFSGNTVSKVTPGGNVSVFAIGLSGPEGLAFDGTGNLYVANYHANTVSEIAPGGAVTTFATGFDGPTGLAFGANGNLYVANALNSLIDSVSPAGAVSPFAQLSTAGVNGDMPYGLTFVGPNLYVTCYGSGDLAEVMPTGSYSYLVAGPFNRPSAIFVAVPEPGTFLLLASSMLAATVALWRRRRIRYA